MECKASISRKRDRPWRFLKSMQYRQCSPLGSPGIPMTFRRKRESERPSRGANRFEKSFARESSLSSCSSRGYEAQIEREAGSFEEVRASLPRLLRPPYLPSDLYFIDVGHSGDALKSARGLELEQHKSGPTRRAAVQNALRIHGWIERAPAFGLRQSSGAFNSSTPIVCRNETAEFAG